MKKSAFFIIATILTGCSVTIPRQFETPESAFPGGTALESSSPGTIASRQSLLNFPFADVFASAEKALSFAQINVTGSYDASGTIYGTRSILNKGDTKRFYYMVVIKEEGPEKCNVSVYSKQQEQAKHFKWLGMVIIPSVALAGLSFGMMSENPGEAAAAAAIYPVLSIPLVILGNRSNEKYAMLKWSPDDDEYLDRIMSFMRTDLLQQ